MRPHRIIACLALAAVPAGASGCGQSPTEKANLGQVRTVVTRFAESSDASACGLLTENALVNVYGGLKAQLREARRNCVKRSVNFKGEPVTITQAQLIDNQTAKVNALSKDRKFTYSVMLRRPKRVWRIDQITQFKTQP